MIGYCGTWYGADLGGFKAMFVDSAYLQVDDRSSEDEGYNEDMVEGASVIDNGGLDWWWMLLALFL
jgi:hypothetical protein